VTEQEPEERVHSPVEGVKVPVLLEEENVTAPPGLSPVTVAVHMVAALTPTAEGEQEIDVVVEALMTVRENVLELAGLFESPL